MTVTNAEKPSAVPCLPKTGPSGGAQAAARAAAIATATVSPAW